MPRMGHEGRRRGLWRTCSCTIRRFLSLLPSRFSRDGRRYRAPRWHESLSDGSTHSWECSCLVQEVQRGEAARRWTKGPRLSRFRLGLVLISRWNSVPAFVRDVPILGDGMAGWAGKVKAFTGKLRENSFLPRAVPQA